MIIKFNKAIMRCNGKWMETRPGPEPDPYNPLNLPPYTLRLLYKDGVTPTFIKAGVVSVQISSSPNIWDVTYNSNIWYQLLRDNTTVKGLLEVLGANTTGVTDMMDMFTGCTYLTNVALFDTSSVTSMERMFHNCFRLTSVPLFDTSKVTVMEKMFYECNQLTSVPLFDTSKVTNMQYMFEECYHLTSVPLFDTSKVTLMGRMFYGCSRLTTVPLFDTSNVTYMTRMFSGCSSLTYIPLFNTSSVISMEQMFSVCRKVEGGALALYQQASSRRPAIVYHSQTFRNCGADTVTGAAELEQIPSNWK